ncbi:MAG: glycosyltransferase family 2 protein [Deltaproteobacteria bacterium]|nr:glycosyltransferase family 2 protein [Deltaproteobacteria bacterium]
MVSIIIVNWNGKMFLERNLSSVFSQTFQQFEVILVDNGSTDWSVEFVRLHFPDVIIIENKENLGFAKGNNQGIRAAKGKYIATLNNDTVVDKEWLSNLVNVAESSENHVGMWAPKILSMKEPAKIDSVGGLLIYKDGIARGRGRGKEDKGQFDKVEGILFPSACSALYRKDMLDDVGLFDEDLFAYCEDTDLGLRGRLAGWKAVSVPDAVVYHHYSGSTGTYSEIKAFLVERNHIWVAIKNFPASMVVLMPFYTLLRWTVQLLHAAKGTGATSSYVKEVSIIRILVVLIKACLSALWGTPMIWKKRAAIQKRRVISINEVRKLLREYRLSAAEVVSE